MYVYLNTQVFSKWPAIIIAISKEKMNIFIKRNIKLVKFLLNT